MIRQRYWMLLVLPLLMGLSAAVWAQKKVMDHSVYDGWKTIAGLTLSSDGEWVAYAINPQEGDGRLEIKGRSNNQSHVIERATNFRFTQDSKFLVATIVPKKADVDKAKKDKVKPEDMPKNSLLIFNLATGEKKEIEKIATYSLPQKDTGWLVYRPEPPKPVTPPSRAAGAASTPATGEKPAEEKKEEPKPKKKADHRPGNSAILLHLPTMKEERIEELDQFAFNENGNVLVLAMSTKDGSGDGIVMRDLKSGKITQVVKQLGRYSRMSLTKEGSALLFTTDKDDYEAKRPAVSVYLYEANASQPKLIAKEGSAGIPEGWWVSPTGALRFSEKGSRVFIPTAPKPEEEKPDTTPPEEKVNVDIWHWKDDMLMSQQLMRIPQDRSRSFDAVYTRSTGKLMQLETPEMESVNVVEQGEGDWALVNDNAPYRLSGSWGEGGSDIYVIDLNTGKREQIFKRLDGGAMSSPSGHFVLAFDTVKQEIWALDKRTMQSKNIGAGIDVAFFDELNDVPGEPGPYGVMGWSKGDDWVFLYDRYDIWALDPAGIQAPRNVTGNYGRTTKTIFRYQRLDPEEEFIPTDGEWLLSAQNEMSRSSGFYKTAFGSRSAPKEVVMKDKAITALAKAKGADSYVFREGTFTQYPDVWVMQGLSFDKATRLSDANPQIKDYNWGTVEQVFYTSLDGVELSGLLYKPEDFDPSKKYPMIAYFYDRSSDTLHQHYSPAPSASTINIPMYVSNGYIVLVPDIPYKVGYPGESAVNAILPAVQTVLKRGYVDPKRVGIQGQSWGGYQVAYLVTETNMFAAACAGAPVSNMFSAYGGIRWESGVVREGQYEKGQSRIAGNIWDKPLRYLENSPLFYVDKIKTPLLIMSNDKDGAVPWYQGIEFFTALRRLDKPAWLVVYNNEAHNLVQRHNRKDWSIRMQQFFDHYLKGAPVPVWMDKGIPAIEKGKNYGFDLVPPKTGSTPPPGGKG